MSETVNQTEACALLGWSPKTLRKRLAPDYQGFDRIEGAVRDGRDWRIPVSEIERIQDRVTGFNDAAIKTAHGIRFAERAYQTMLAGDRAALDWAAKQYVADPTPENLRVVSEAAALHREGLICERLIRAMRRMEQETMRSAHDAINDFEPAIWEPEGLTLEEKIKLHTGEAEGSDE